MKLARVMRHLFTNRWSVRRRFTPGVLAEIEAAVRDVEARHAGEIRFAVEASLDLPELLRDLSPRTLALQVFSRIGLWDTADNNGVLIYVLLADRDVEIVADRGIAARVTREEWEHVCREMELHYRAGRFAEGSIAGIQAVGGLLGRHFPSRRANGDEQPNQPVLL